MVRALARATGFGPYIAYQIFALKLPPILICKLNICMNKQELQRQIQQQERSDTQTADTWLKRQGIAPALVAHTHGRLLRAQSLAHQLLTENRSLLSDQQITTLEAFQYKMTHRHIRQRLKPEAGNRIFNIGSKIQRQLFKQHRQLTKA